MGENRGSGPRERCSVDSTASCPGNVRGGLRMDDWRELSYAVAHIHCRTHV